MIQTLYSNACRAQSLFREPSETEEQLSRAGLGKGVWGLPRVSLVLGPSTPVFKGQRDRKRKEKRTFYTGPEA